MYREKRREFNQRRPCFTAQRFEFPVRIARALRNTLWIGLAGAIGSMARYHLGAWVQRLAGGAFPLWTLTVNLLGSLAMGAIFAIAARGTLSETTQLALATGLLGGFTTYSAFNQETLRLLQTGALPVALGYVAATLFGCLGAGYAGFTAVRLLP